MSARESALLSLVEGALSLKVTTIECDVGFIVGRSHQPLRNNPFVPWTKKNQLGDAEMLAVAERAERYPKKTPAIATARK